jgi:type IV pilus assembly protein PilE
MKHPRPTAGFTLLDVMIALVITAILLSLALPAYGAYVVRARRAGAQAHMLELLQLQERHFARHYRYLAFSADLPAPADSGMRWWSGDVPARSAFEFSARPCDGFTLQQCVVVDAVPGTARVNPSLRDEECGTLSVSSRGERRSATDNARCWP